MANTVATDLIVDQIVLTGETLAKGRLAPLSAFVKDFSQKEIPANRNQLQKEQLSIVEGVAEVKTNPTSFNIAGTGDMKARAITPSLYSAPLSNSGYNGFDQLRDWVTASMYKLANAIMGAVGTAITAASFDAVQIDITNARDIAKIDMLWRDLYASMTKGDRKYVIANTLLYSKSIQQNQITTPMGFDGIYECAQFNSGASAGIITDGRGLAMVSRIPTWGDNSGGFINSTNVTLDDLGLTVQLNEWFDIDSRQDRASIDVIFGCAAFDKTATKTITDQAGA